MVLSKEYSFKQFSVIDTEISSFYSFIHHEHHVENYLRPSIKDNSCLRVFENRGERRMCSQAHV